MTLNTAIYTRISAEEQACTGFGLEAQREECQAMAAAKGWLVAAEFSDGPSSTKRAISPGLARFLEAACGGEIGAVIFPSLDRLGNRIHLVVRLLTRLNECGVIIVSCEEALDTETASGRFALSMFAALSELALENNVVERTTKGRDARGRIDGERGGQMPMGYKRVFDETGDSIGVEVNDSEAETVQYIFVLRARGNSLQTVADRLNELGVKTSRGKQWHASSVKIVLDNENKYRGGRRWESSYRWPRILAY